MSSWSRLFIVVGVLLLLGLGLCGVGLWSSGNAHSEHLTAAFVGLGISCFAVFTLIVGSIAIVVTRWLGHP